MNLIILQGRLTKEPEIKYTTINNTKVGEFTLAVNRRFVEETDFIDCVTYGKTADIVEKYLHKGNLITINGSLQIRKWKDKEDKPRQKAEVVVNEIYFNNNKNNNSEEKQVEEKEENKMVVEEDAIYTDDLPF